MYIENIICQVLHALHIFIDTKFLPHISLLRIIDVEAIEGQDQLQHFCLRENLYKNVDVLNVRVRVYQVSSLKNRFICNFALKLETKVF